MTQPMDLTTEKKTCKLTYEEQLRLINDIALYVPVHEIVARIKYEHNKDISENNVHYYGRAQKWQSQINKIRDEFEAKIADEEFASKRRRIQEFSRLYRKLAEKDELRAAADILTKIRDEVEIKTSGATQINQYNQYNAISDDELRRVIEENNRMVIVGERIKKEITVEPEDKG